MQNFWLIDFGELNQELGIFQTIFLNYFLYFIFLISHFCIQDGNVYLNISTWYQIHKRIYAPKLLIPSTLKDPICSHLVILQYPTFIQKISQTSKHLHVAMHKRFVLIYKDSHAVKSAYLKSGLPPVQTSPLTHLTVE